MTPDQPANWQHDSPFFRLPPEIRNRIYETALIKPGSIDLYPSASVCNVPQMRCLVKNDPDYLPLKTHVLMRELDRRSRKLGPADNSFRIQKDLWYVRTNLAAGVLRTCRRAYFEAAGIFYARNIWRSSHGHDWHILLRFLITIGPRARSWIQNLEVLAPMVNYDIRRDFSPVPNKNHPKMHMVKLSYERQYNCRTKTFQLLTMEKRLETINFVVPSSYGIYDFHKDKTVLESCFPLDFPPKITVTLEPGALLFNLAVEDFTHRGWNLTAAPDRTHDIDEYNPDRTAINPTDVTKTWKGREGIVSKVAQTIDEGINEGHNNGRTQSLSL
ncbi:MAG: hypothetical protein Q9166_003255 [cf. Caloplaca sp. 2 TL-2023]